MTPDEFRSARWKLGQLWGLSKDEALTPGEMADVLGLRGKDPSASVLDYERGKTAISGPLELALEALLSGWEPKRLPELMVEWGWEDDVPEPEAVA